MAMGSFGMFTLFMMLLSGGASDLLDFVSSDHYWKSKGVQHVTAQILIDELKPAAAGPDVGKLIASLGAGNFEDREKAAREILKQGPAVIPQLEAAAAHPDLEIANRSRNLIQQLKVSSKGIAVRKLLAIRTLGEMKKAEALPALKALSDSKEMFVADYAKTAIAMIEGKPLPPRAPPQGAMKADLSLLPANCGLVGQIAVVAPPGNVQRLSVDEALKQLPPTPGQDPQQAFEQMQKHILQIAEQVGNVRLEGLTFGVSEDVGDQKGFVAVIFRGQYDSKAAPMILRNIIPNANIVDGVEMFSPDPHMAFGFPSDHRALFTVGPNQEQLPVKALLAAVRENKGPLLTNADLANLISKIDTTAPMWAVCKVNENYRQVPVVKAFDTVTLVAKQEKETLALNIKGAGADPAAVQSAVNEITQGLNQAKQFAPQMIQMSPAFKPIIDFVNSAKCEANGNQAAFTASVPGNGNALMAVPLFLFGARADVHQAPPGQP